MVAPSIIFSDIVFGILLGCVFAVAAHGLNIIWGVVKVVNIAHGEFIMLGAYGAYFLNLLYNLNPVIAAIVDALVGFGVGLLFYFALLHKELAGKESVSLQSEMVTLVSTFGLSLVISNFAVIAFTGNNVGVNWSPGTLELGFLRVPLGALYVAIASIAIIAITHLFLSKTYLGNAIRAYSQDITATQLIGANPTKIAAIATAIGFAITMASGALLAVWVPVGINPYMGILYAPISFVIVVLGGPGKMWGSFVGGLIVGIIFDVSQAFVSPALAYALAFLILIPVLIFSPEGIMK